MKDNRRIAPKYHRKAAIMDAVGVFFLLLFSALMGMIVLILSAPTAKADGYIDAAELDYAQMYGYGAICPVIDNHHTAAGVIGVGRGIMADGFTADSAVDIINYSVQTYCPRNWPLLVNIGNAARATAIT